MSPSACVFEPATLILSFAFPALESTENKTGNLLLPGEDASAGAAPGPGREGGGPRVAILGTVGESLFPQGLLASHLPSAAPKHKELGRGAALPEPGWEKTGFGVQIPPHSYEDEEDFSSSTPSPNSLTAAWMAGGGG